MVAKIVAPIATIMVLINPCRINSLSKSDEYHLVLNPLHVNGFLLALKLITTSTTIGI
jgi:hypothetical protein